MSHQTFWKPEKQVKEKKSYNSLQRAKAKQKSKASEWKKDILSHHKSNPSRADRAEFPTVVVNELIRKADGMCQCGCGRPDQSTHHVMPRGRGGRGVKTNGLRLNNFCHDRIQTNEEELQYWINIYREKYGDFFWFDEKDWEEHRSKEVLQQKAQQEKKQRMESIKPIINLVSTATGRNVTIGELRLIEGMNTKELDIFSAMMNDVVHITTSNEV